MTALEKLFGSESPLIISLKTGADLKSARARLGLSARELALQTGLSHSKISQAEANENAPLDKCIVMATSSVLHERLSEKASQQLDELDLSKEEKAKLGHLVLSLLSKVVVTK